MTSRLIATSVMAAAFIAMPCIADVYASGEVGYIPPVTSAPSTLTRAQVIAELMESRAAPAPVPTSTLTRAEVIAELVKAQREGTVPPTAEGADIGLVAAPRKDLVAPQPTLAAR